jgi:hypothetical protein
MMDLMGALLTGSVATTTKVEEDVDGRPPAGVSIPSCAQTQIGSYKAKHVKQ